MSVCAQARGPEVAAWVSHRRVLADVPELRHRVSSDELQDLPAGEPTADRDEKSVHLPPAAQGFSERGWDSDSRNEYPNREGRGRGNKMSFVDLIKDNRR